MLTEQLFAANGGTATTRQLLGVMTRKALAVRVASGRFIRVRRGVYTLAAPDLTTRLAALDAAAERPIVACMGTAATLYGFDTENTARVHVLDPGIRMRPSSDVMVHQRVGAPLRRVDGRLATAPAWTAIELARTLWRPRALATLDAAVHVEACTVGELRYAVVEQKGRRGIVRVRELLDLVDGRSESPLESEARLVFHDHGLPEPQVQYWIRDLWGDLWRVDFAWPEAKLVAEYDSLQWHLSEEALVHDRLKTARLQECGWTTVPMTAADIRRKPRQLVLRIETHLDRASFTARAGAKAPNSTPE